MLLPGLILRGIYGARLKKGDGLLQHWASFRKLHSTASVLEWKSQIRDISLVYHSAPNSTKFSTRPWLSFSFLKKIHIYWLLIWFYESPKEPVPFIRLNKYENENNFRHLSGIREANSTNSIIIVTTCNWIPLNNSVLLILRQRVKNKTFRPDCCFIIRLLWFYHGRIALRKASCQAQENNTSEDTRSSSSFERGSRNQRNEEDSSEWLFLSAILRNYRNDTLTGTLEPKLFCTSQLSPTSAFKIKVS